MNRVIAKWHGRARNAGPIGVSGHTLFRSPFGTLCRMTFPPAVLIGNLKTSLWRGVSYSLCLFHAKLGTFLIAFTNIRFHSISSASQHSCNRQGPVTLHGGVVYRCAWSHCHFAHIYWSLKVIVGKISTPAWTVYYTRRTSFILWHFCVSELTCIRVQNASVSRGFLKFIVSKISTPKLVHHLYKKTITKTYGFFFRRRRLWCYSNPALSAKEKHLNAIYHTKPAPLLLSPPRLLESSVVWSIIQLSVPYPSMQ